MAPLIRSLTETLTPYLDKPFAFFGHSLGVLVSFELVRQLRRERKCGPVHLFVSGHRAPQIPDPDPPIHALPDAEFLEELQRLNGTPQEMLENDELMKVVLPTLRADFRVAETYVYEAEPPLDCPISVFGGVRDPEVNREQLMAWRQQTTKTYSLQMFPGDHFFLHSSETALLRTLSAELETIVKTAV